MIPLRYQVVGEEDYTFSIEISETGDFVVNTGTYTSHPPRKGQLSKSQEEMLIGAIKALGIPTPHPVPGGGEAFAVHLVIGDEGEETHYPFWEGALEEDEKLSDLVRVLEKI